MAEGLEKRSGWKGQRSFDLALTLVLVPLLIPLIAVLALAVLICDGCPVFYGAERMATPTRPFTLWKFRSMTRCDRGATARLLGPDNAAEVTRLGHWLRRTHLDELPQLWNILRGDIGFVGPRPPLQRYTVAEPEIYAEVLQHRPGVTGLATIIFGGQERAILSRATSAEEAHAIYLRRCIPRKARLDRLHRLNASPRLTVYIIYLTLLNAAQNPAIAAKHMRQYHRHKI